MKKCHRQLIASGSVAGGKARKSCLLALLWLFSRTEGAPQTHSQKNDISLSTQFTTAILNLY